MASWYSGWYRLLKRDNFKLFFIASIICSENEKNQFRILKWLFFPLLIDPNESPRKERRRRRTRFSMNVAFSILSSTIKTNERWRKKRLLFLSSSFLPDGRHFSEGRRVCVYDDYYSLPVSCWLSGTFSHWSINSDRTSTYRQDKLLFPSRSSVRLLVDIHTKNFLFFHSSLQIQSRHGLDWRWWRSRKKCLNIDAHTSPSTAKKTKGCVCVVGHSFRPFDDIWSMLALHLGLAWKNTNSWTYLCGTDCSRMSLEQTEHSFVWICLGQWNGVNEQDHIVVPTSDSAFPSGLNERVRWRREKKLPFIFTSRRRVKVVEEHWRSK